MKPAVIGIAAVVAIVAGILIAKKRAETKAMDEAFAVYDKFCLAMASERINEARTYATGDQVKQVIDLAYETHVANARAGISLAQNPVYTIKYERGAQSRTGDSVTFVTNKKVLRSPAGVPSTNIKNMIVEEYSDEVELTGGPGAWKVAKYVSRPAK